MFFYQLGDLSDWSELVNLFWPDPSDGVMLYISVSPSESDTKIIFPSFHIGELSVLMLSVNLTGFSFNEISATKISGLSSLSDMNTILFPSGDQ